MAKERRTPAPNLPDDWTSYLKKMRARHGDLTLSEAAKKLGVSVNTYCNWEYGRNKPNHFAALHILAVFGQP